MSLTRISAATESNVPQIKGKKDQTGEAQLGLFGKIFGKLHAQSKVNAKPENAEIPQSEKEVIHSTANGTNAGEDKPQVKNESAPVAATQDDQHSDETGTIKESATPIQSPADTNASVKTEATPKLSGGNPGIVPTVDPGNGSDAANVVSGNPKVVNPTLIQTNLNQQAPASVAPQLNPTPGQTPVLQMPGIGQNGSFVNGGSASIQQNNPAQAIQENLTSSGPTPPEAVAPNQSGSSKPGAPVPANDSQISHSIPQQSSAARPQTVVPETLDSSVKPAIAPEISSMKTSSNPVVASKTLESNTPQSLQNNNQPGKFSSINPERNTLGQNSDQVTNSKTTPEQVRNISPPATAIRQTAAPNSTHNAQSTLKETPEPRHANMAPAPNQQAEGVKTPGPNAVGNTKTNIPAPSSSPGGAGVQTVTDQNTVRVRTISAKPIVESASSPVITDRSTNPNDANTPIITPRVKAGVALPDVAAPAPKIAQANELSTTSGLKNPIVGQVPEELPVENSTQKSLNQDAGTLTRVSVMQGKLTPESSEPDRKKTEKETESKLGEKTITQGGKSVSETTTRSTARSEFDRIQDFFEGKKAGGKFMAQELQSNPRQPLDSNPSANEKGQNGVESAPATHARFNTPSVNNSTSAADSGLLTDRVEGSKNSNAAATAPVSAVPKDVPSLPEMIHRVLNLIEVRMRQNQGVQQMQVKTGSYGTLNIQLTRDAQTRRVTILVETESARDAVRMSLPAITANLDRKGINLNSIDVRLPWEQPAEKQQTSSQDQNFQKNLGSQTDSNDGRGSNAPRDPGNHANSPTPVNPQPKSTRRDFGYNTMEIVA
ncbi:MAG TPA: hypothetical protein DHU63_03925 [Candidatus Marinimicrobia bacterium]|nr:hypothetical protein [Candidatus Neomarinimicrobiota bacterium]